MTALEKAIIVAPLVRHIFFNATMARDEEIDDIDCMVDGLASVWTKDSKMYPLLETMPMHVVGVWKEQPA